MEARGGAVAAGEAVKCSGGSRRRHSCDLRRELLGVDVLPKVGNGGEGLDKALDFGDNFLATPSWLRSWKCPPTAARSTFKPRGTTVLSTVSLPLIRKLMAINKI